MSEIGSPSGTVIGYDPGGAEAHGVAILFVEAGKAVRLSTSTVSTAEQVIELVESTRGVVALGIDTLTCWATGPSGWRPADRWLRGRYRPVAHSVVAPNALRGSMAVSGMAVLMTIAHGHPALFVTETHPKVLFWFLSQSSYSYTDQRTFMDDALTRVLGVRATPANEHGWEPPSLPSWP